MGDEPRLYLIEWGDETTWIEAESFRAAIEVWQQHWNDALNEGEEPDSARLVHDGAVLRRVVFDPVGAFGRLLAAAEAVLEECRDETAPVAGTIGAVYADLRKAVAVARGLST